MNPVSFLRDSISLTMTKAGEAIDTQFEHRDTYLTMKTMMEYLFQQAWRLDGGRKILWSSTLKERIQNLIFNFISTLENTLKLN
jgi:hypothetical protein